MPVGPIRPTEKGNGGVPLFVSPVASVAGACDKLSDSVGPDRIGSASEAPSPLPPGKRT